MGDFTKQTYTLYVQTYDNTLYGAYAVEGSVLESQGFSDYGPRFQLWTTPRAGRQGIYRGYKAVPGTSFQTFWYAKTPAEITSAGFSLGNNGQPIGYAAELTSTTDISAPLLMASDASTGRMFLTNDPTEVAGWKAGLRLTPQWLGLATPRLSKVWCVLEGTTVHKVSNDPNEWTEGTVNVDYGEGQHLEFICSGAGEFPSTGALTITDTNGTNMIGANLPFQITSQTSERIVVNDNDLATTNTQYNYTIGIVNNGVLSTSDPKIINRAPQIE